MALADEPAPDAMAFDDDDAAGDEVGAAAGVLDPDELQAAAPTATLAAMPDTAMRRRLFMISPRLRLGRGSGFGIRGSGFWMRCRRLRLR
jgi:hypothetical protein